MAGYKVTGLGAATLAGDALRYEQQFSVGANIASAGTINLATATGQLIHITGITTITAVTLTAGVWRQLIFDDALTLTHHATTNNLPGGANITTAAGDRALYWSDGTTVYCMAYQKASGESVVATTFLDTQPVVKGSVDATKLLRFEVDGFTAATTRVVTVADRNIEIGKYPTRQTFLSGSGTYTTPAGATYIKIRMVGGGAGGSAALTNNGTLGADTTFGTLTAGRGALGGGSAGLGGAGGTATNGDINITGGSGTGGQTPNGGTISLSGGAGGNSALGGGGAGGAQSNGGGNAPANSGGGGGGGGGNSTTNSGCGGGAGAYLEKQINAPSATYAYAVGGGGTGGTAGTNAGGNGGSGIIIVDEYYN